MAELPKGLSRDRYSCRWRTLTEPRVSEAKNSPCWPRRDVRKPGQRNVTTANRYFAIAERARRCGRSLCIEDDSPAAEPTHT